MAWRKVLLKPQKQVVKHANDDYEQRTVIKSLPRSYQSKQESNHKSSKLNKKSSYENPDSTINAHQSIKRHNQTHKQNDLAPHDTISGKLHKINDDPVTSAELEKRKHRQNATQQSNPYSSDKQEKKEELRQKQLHNQQIHRKQTNYTQPTTQLIPGLRGPLDETKRRKNNLGYVYIKQYNSQQVNNKQPEGKILAEGTIRKMSQLFPNKDSSTNKK